MSGSEFGYPPGTPPPVARYDLPAPSRRPAAWRLWALLMLLVALIASPMVAERIQYAISRGRLRAEVDTARQGLTDLKDTTAAFRLAAQSVGPSVVHIDVEQSVSGGQRTGDELESVFPRRMLSGQGSGVIIDEAGYVLTNYHVIAHAEKIRVLLSDGRQIGGVDVIGTDPASDLAVLKIAGGGLIAAPWGDSDQLHVGDWILAVGNPFGLDRSVTAGIVSAKSRRGVVNGGQYQDFLQTDAAVNPGNSGGPLVNLAGEVVGINTAIVGESYQGISFAIPSRMAREVFEELRAKGSVERGWLGVAPQSVTPELSAELRVGPARGAVVAEVVPTSPAAVGGILAGDVIVRYDGTDVADPADLILKVARTKPGTKVKVELVRDENQMTVEVEVGSRNRDLPQAMPGRRR